MATDGYTLKELVKELRKEQSEHRDRTIRMEETLNKVLEQATRTNGRLLRAEQLIDGLQDEHKRVSTIFATVTVILTGVWTVLTFIVK